MLFDLYVEYEFSDTIPLSQRNETVIGDIHRILNQHATYSSGSLTL